jgi:colanic acid/amylovoran biosynthesis glycosyltransferase
MQNAELLYYGINTDFFNSTLKNKINEDIFTFLQISAFKEKKGHIYTLRAFKVFLDKVKDRKKYKIILAGGWTLLEQIKKEAILLGISEYIEFTGPINHDEAKQLLLRANVFIHHSITAFNGDTEGLPNAIIEAMAMELPILSTWHAGIPELVEDSVNGYLVYEKDIAFYAQRMKDILNWEYQPKNREKVISLFSNEVHFQSLNRIYEKHKNYDKKQTEKLEVMHLFSSYPGSNTTNWLYNLITNIPNCKVTHYKRQISTWSLKLYDKMACYLSEKLVGNFSKHLNNEIAKRKTDIVHAHFADVGCEYVDIIKQKEFPFVISFYGYDYEYLPHIKPIYLKKYKKLFLKADKFICEGTNGVDILVKMGCPKEKVEIVKLGVETDRIPFQIKSKVCNKLNLVQIAALREKKGHIYALKAFHKVLIECPNMHLTFVGSGEIKIYNQLKEYVINNQLDKNVTILNEIDFSKLHEYISEFDVFIHPSCYSNDKDCEGGAPIVLLDAQACGLPIISTTHCDIPDEVAHKKTGLLTPEKDVDALAGSIKYFYRITDEEYRNFSDAARRHVVENYSIKKNAIRLKEIYNSLINFY